MLRKFATVCALVVLGSIAAQAANRGPATVAGVQTRPDGSVYFRTTGLDSSSTKYMYFTLNSTMPGFDGMLAGLYSAQRRGSMVTVSFDSSATTCPTWTSGTYTEIYCSVSKLWAH